MGNTNCDVDFDLLAPLFTVLLSLVTRAGSLVTRCPLILLNQNLPRTTLLWVTLQETLPFTQLLMMGLSSVVHIIRSLPRSSNQVYSSHGPQAAMLPSLLLPLNIVQTAIQSSGLRSTTPPKLVSRTSKESETVLHSPLAL